MFIISHVFELIADAKASAQSRQQNMYLIMQEITLTSEFHV